MTSRREILVIGGGIGGLAAAAFMRRAGLAATVYEQAAALGEVGAGLRCEGACRHRSRRADAPGRWHGQCGAAQGCLTSTARV